MLRWRRPFVVVDGGGGGGGGGCEIAGEGDDTWELDSFSVIDACLKRGGKFWGETVVELLAALSRDDGDGDDDDDDDCWVAKNINGVGFSTDGNGGGVGG